MTVLESLISGFVFHQPLRSMYSLYLLLFLLFLFPNFGSLDACPNFGPTAFFGVVWSTVRWWHAAQRPGHHIFVRREPLGWQRKNGRAFWFPTFAGQVCRWIV